MADMVILITASIMVTSLMGTYPMEISAGVTIMGVAGADIMVGVVVMAGTAEGMAGAADIITANINMDLTH